MQPALVGVLIGSIDAEGGLGVAEENALRLLLREEVAHVHRVRRVRLRHLLARRRLRPQIEVANGRRLRVRLVGLAAFVRRDAEAVLRPRVRVRDRARGRRCCAR
jgi:hypothetical protein